MQKAKETNKWESAWKQFKHIKTLAISDSILLCLMGQIVYLNVYLCLHNATHVVLHLKHVELL